MLGGEGGRPSLVTCRDGVNDDLGMALGRNDESDGTARLESVYACVWYTE
jgi:hypothetical protein